MLRFHEAPQIILSLGVLALLAVLLVAPVTLRAEDSDYVDASEYVEVFDGDMPLMLAVGHGGWKQVGEEKNGCSPADPLLHDYFYKVLAMRIYEKTGHLPYIVYQQGKRDYVNTNSEVDSSSAYHPNNTEARDAYFEFHNQVDAMIARIEDEYGADMALMINPHTTDLVASRGDCPWDRITDIGFIASVTNLGSTANTMKALYDRKGEAALRGEDSIPYQLFHGQDWPTPDAAWPEAATTNSKTLAQTGDDVWHVLPAWVTGYDTNNWSTAYFNGAKVVRYHGTNTWGHLANWSNRLDAFQMEVNYTSEAGIGLPKTDPEYDPDGHYHQLDVSFTTDFVDDFIDAILHSLQANYNWTPGGVYNVVVDNGDANFSTTGDWTESKDQGAWSTASIYTKDAGATATWTPSLTQAGTYVVLIRWTKTGTRTPNAQYTVNYAGGSRTFTIDQSGGQDAKWARLGTFHFNAGTSGNVTLECTGTETATVADATIFRLIHMDSASYLPVVLSND